MVTIQMLQSFEFWIRIRVPKIDECETNTLSLPFVVDSSTYRTSLFDGVLKFRVPDVVQLLRTIVQEFLRREEVRWYRSS